MLTWEYPPRIEGGLAQHVFDLSHALSRQGVEITVITCGTPGAPPFEDDSGIKVYRVTPYAISPPDFPLWVLQLNTAMLETAIPVIQKNGEPDIIHAHDWLVAFAARALKHAYRLPLVVTIHATEFGRHNGLHTPLQNYISNVEWWLTFEAWRVIVCSRYMENELKYIFQLPHDKIRIIHNGVDPANYEVRAAKVTRDLYAAPDEKIVFYIGRLVREKGVQVLLRAAPKILAGHPRTKFVIGGRGPYEEELKRLAASLGLAQSVYFTGYVDNEVRNDLYAWADVAVFPSLYEPFGIVALEAMAAKTPVVVSDTGGLSEIVEHEVDGLKVPVDAPDALANAVLRLLCNPDLGRLLRDRAYQKVVTQYNWQRVARETRSVYKAVREERQRSNWVSPLDTPKIERLFGKVTQIFGRYT